MIKKILVLVVIILCYTESKAQQFNLGAKTGVNFVILNNDNSTKNISGFNYHLGAVGLLAITEKFSIQPELLYSTQHYSYETLRYHLDYINLPVLADYKVVKGLSLQAGPQFGFNINKKLKDKGGDDTPGFEGKLNNAETLSIGAGFGLQYKLPNNIFFQTRYTLGLTDIYDNSNAKFGILSLSVGYFIF